MDRYIEVIGEGSFHETAARFIATVRFEVRAAKDETALREVSELVNDALALFREAGLSDEEITEGGTELHRPWHWKKQVGQNSSRQVILKVADYGRLTHALELLEPLQTKNKERKTISIEMRQPEFAETTDAQANALADAFADAKSKATKLVSAMNCRLGSPLQVEEGGLAKRNSGFSGDEDWWGDNSRFGAPGSVMLAAPNDMPSEPAPDLQRPTRTIFVKCRVRFAIEDG